MKEKELFLVVKASLLICAVIVYVSVFAEEPYTTECLGVSLEDATISLEDATIIEYDPDWAWGTWFDWDLANMCDYGYCIIVEPR